MIVARKKIITTLLIIGFFSWVKSARSDDLNQKQIFSINPTFSENRITSATATLRHVSEKAYFYVDDNFWNELTEDKKNTAIAHLLETGKEFDSRIYPIETSFFGSEPNPGIDDDPRITILFGRLAPTIGGYYDSENQAPKRLAPDSNEREIIYLNSSVLVENVLNKTYGFLAHEFQHLISFNQKENRYNIHDETWINELRSEYAIQLLGYNTPYNNPGLERIVNSFKRNPFDSLTEWKNIEFDYAQVNLFGQYLAEHWSPQIIADSGKVGVIGMQSIDAALARNGFLDSFEDVFKDWTVAVVINDSSIGQKLGFINADLKNIKITPSSEISNLVSQRTIIDRITPWQINAYALSNLQPNGNDVIRVRFDSTEFSSFAVRYVTENTSGIKKVFELDTGKTNTLYISGIGGDIKKVTLIPLLKRPEGFNNPTTLITTIDRVSSVPTDSIKAKELLFTNVAISAQTDTAVQKEIRDGNLIRTLGDSKVYLVGGAWKHHIKNPEVMKIYNFSFDNVKEVSSETASRFQESNLIRSTNSKRVYEIDAVGIRHWLNMTEYQFRSSARSADAIFNIDPREFSFYKQGNTITR